jgi:DNA-binding NarL/FixJ family response regulator
MPFEQSPIDPEHVNTSRAYIFPNNFLADMTPCQYSYTPFSDSPAIMSSLKVVLVEDSPAVRERLAHSLRSIDDVELIGEYEDANTAIDGIRNGAPHVVLLDIKLCGSSGMDVMRYVEQSKIDVKVIVLTNYAEPQYRELFLRQGAHAVLDKSHEFHRVEELLLQIIDGR